MIFREFSNALLCFVLQCAGAEIDGGGVFKHPHQVVENPEAHQGAGCASKYYRDFKSFSKNLIDRLNAPLWYMMWTVQKPLRQTKCALQYKEVIYVLIRLPVAYAQSFIRCILMTKTYHVHCTSLTILNVILTTRYNSSLNDRFTSLPPGVARGIGHRQWKVTGDPIQYRANSFCIRSFEL